LFDHCLLIARELFEEPKLLIGELDIFNDEVFTKTLNLDSNFWRFAARSFVIRIADPHYCVLRLPRLAI